MIKEDDLYTTKECAEILKVSTKTILRRLASKDLVWLKIGRNWRIKGSVLINFINGTNKEEQ